MLRAAIGFFVIGLIAFAIGAGNIAGVSIEIGKTLLYVFLFLAVVSFVISVVMGGNKGTLKTLALVTAVAGTGLTIGYNSAVAEETTLEKVQNEVGDATTDAKIAARKKKKEIRDATGNESLIEDAKDAGRNAKDRIENEADKIKRKLD